MQVNSNLASMIQLEKKLEQSATALSKLGQQNNQKEEKENKNIKQQPLKYEPSHDIDIVSEMVKQIEIPIAYDANAKVISTSNSIHETLLDIKA
ncbi:MAG: flagellar basal body rod C-terminal domain-containing protein [Campylobacterota bacterium]|nr:flagellar basal body rod C-terminal domain-containing protein [Campylobacterota bacterium]